MKKLVYLIIGLALTALVSCQKHYCPTYKGAVQPHHYHGPKH
ncbi:MAG: hypothetical protein SNJ77_01815 [Cytophagales bacterium]